MESNESRKNGTSVLRGGQKFVEHLYEEKSFGDSLRLVPHPYLGAKGDTGYQLLRNRAYGVRAARVAVDDIGLFDSAK